MGGGGEFLDQHIGNRVQMGQTPIEIASHLVGYGYMNLVGVDDKVAHTCFMPDPVCARLAMCLMDENWNTTLKGHSQIQGWPKSWWVEKLKFIYSGDLCTPEKGDFGEIMVAFYFLFCANVLRSPPMRHSLSRWVTGFTISYKVEHPILTKLANLFLPKNSAYQEDL